MKLKQAIGLLETHNRWRRGEDIEPMLKPTDIGIAIDTVVEYIKNNGVLDDVISCKFCKSGNTSIDQDRDELHCFDCETDYYL